MTSKCLNLNHNITITHPYKQQQQAIVTTSLKLFLSSTLCIISSTRFHIQIFCKNTFKTALKKIPLSPICRQTKGRSNAPF
jgi:hypothetical protein